MAAKTIVSLFDGISVARVALEKSGIEVENYYAYEIDPKAIAVSKKNYPSNTHMGGVPNTFLGRRHDDIFLLVGGSPCQDLSIAKRNREGLKGMRSSLFWAYVDALKNLNPRYFIFENVASMSVQDKDTITEALGVEPIMIDAALVSAQSRKRLFWTNIPNVSQPDDRRIMLKDVLLPDTYTEYDKAYTLTASYNGAVLWNSIGRSQRTMVWTKPIQVGYLKNNGQAQRVYSIDGKSVTLKALGGGMGAKTGLYQIKDYARKLEPIECERLQSLPDGYTECDGVSKDARRKMLGNAFNANVIAHILSFIPGEER